LTYTDKIVPLEEALRQRALFKDTGKRVIFTNGCFDIIHKGHISYLEEARGLGDILIVGLNSDASVTRLKGQYRPLKGIENRAAVLAGLASVDVVVVFEEDTPQKLIEQLNPDILVKGGDYSIENIVGADFVLIHGGEVKTIDFIPGYSSSQIIQKMEANKDENKD
jgi:rfaE bifunctional protein nucleotidyltransferase chain/domain